jgi:hypothetical protein
MPTFMAFLLIPVFHRMFGPCSAARKRADTVRVLRTKLAAQVGRRATTAHIHRVVIGSHSLRETKRS